MSDTPDMPRETTFAERLLQRVFLVQPGEGARLLLAGTYFFVVLCSYYMIRPMREQMGLAGGVKNLSWLMTATLGAMLLANPIYAMVVSRLPRRRFVPLVYRFFALNVLAFYGIMLAHPSGETAVWIGRVFYVWSSVFNLFVVSVFWSVMADAHTTEQAKRLFGAIGIGGTLGAIAGSAVTERITAARIEPMYLLLVSAALLECAVWCFRGVWRRSAMGGTGDVAAARALAGSELAGGTPAPQRGAREPTRDVLAGFLGVAESPYLLSICLYMFLFTITGTLLYMEQARIVDATIVGKEAQTRYFAQVDLATNLLTLFLQVFVTGRLVTRFGLPVALLILPVLTLAGFGWMLVAPSVLLVAGFQVLRRGAHYAVDRPAREALFTVLSADDKYKAKAFIDTFVYRAGDVFGAWLPTVVRSQFASPVVATAAAGVLALGWITNAAVLGMQHRRKARGSA